MIPLVEHAGGAGVLANTYVLDRVDTAVDASGLRPEIAPLMDHGLYGSASTALSYFEAHPLPRGFCTAMAGVVTPRRRFRLGVREETGIHVAEDRSADLGLALAFFGASSGVPLSHVVATGSLRRGDGREPASEPGGQVHSVSGLEQKAQLVGELISRKPAGEVVFMFPGAALRGDADGFSQAIERLHALARSEGVAFAAKPVDSMMQALGELGLRRQAGGGTTCLVAALAVIALAGYLAADRYMNRPLALRWDKLDWHGELVQLPVMAVPRTDDPGARDLCAIVKGADQVAVAEIGSVLLFAVADDAGKLPAKSSMALVAVFEQTVPSVLPLTGAREKTIKGEDASWINYDFQATVEEPAEYTRLMVVARRYGAINLDRLNETVTEIANAPGSNKVAAVSNYLQTHYPGYIEFGYRSTDQDLPCTLAH